MTKMKWLLGLVLTAGALAYGIERAEAGLFEKKCPPPPPIKVILVVCDPCTGCTYDVPVCVPACCCGAPTACFKDTLFGNGKVTYTWECGHKVVIRFPKGGGYRVAAF